MKATASFADLLRQYRVAANLTQEALAERAGISPSAIAALERGRRRAPRSDTAALLADALALSVPERTTFIAAAATARDPASPIEDVTAATPPLAGLPASPTALIGREREEAAVVYLLQQGARLVTLVGPGGVGKTHLALQVANAVQGAYAAGAAFVDLAPVRDPDEVAAAVAHALGLHETGASYGRSLVVEHLKSQQMLLVLDNFEQVIGAAAFVADVVNACPELTLLITSRAPLRLRVEQRFPVAPLDVPSGGAPSLQEAAACSAVQLFVGRAQAVRLDFALSGENMHAVVDICRRLDGLPLAIELAAARVRLLPPAALLGRLDQRLSALAAGPRDLPERQQTLHNTIAWSYDLLDPVEQQLFQVLAVFVGGFTLPAVEAVWHGGADRPSDLDVLDGVASLVEKNLLQAAEGYDGEARYSLLETIRAYATDLLAASGMQEMVQERHAAYFLQLAEEADPHLRSGEREVWLGRLRRDSDNLRAALSWSEHTPGAAPLGLRLAAALTWFWRFYEWLHEGRSWLEAMLARTDGSQVSLVRGKALYGVGMLAWYQGDLATAATRTEASVTLFRALDDRPWLATALRLLGLIRMGQGDPAAARHLLDEAHHVFHAVGDRWGEAMTLYRLGLAAAESGDPSARAYYEHSLALFRQVGDMLGIAVVLNALAVAAAAHGDEEEALSIIAEGLPLARQATDRWDLARLLNNAGTLWLRRGDDRQAQGLFVESLHLWRDIGQRAGLALSLAGLGGVAAARGESERAGRLFGAARSLLPPADPFMTASSSADLDQRIAEAQQRLEPAAFAAGWAAGEALSPDDAVSAALAL